MTLTLSPLTDPSHPRWKRIYGGDGCVLALSVDVSNRIEGKEKSGRGGRDEEGGWEVEEEEEKGGEGEEGVRSETGAGSRLRKMGPFFFVFSKVAGKIRGWCFEPTIIRL